MTFLGLILKATNSESVRPVVGANADTDAIDVEVARKRASHRTTASFFNGFHLCNTQVFLCNS